MSKNEKLRSARETFARQLLGTPPPRKPITRAGRRLVNFMIGRPLDAPLENDGVVPDEPPDEQPADEHDVQPSDDMQRAVNVAVQRALAARGLGED